MQRLRRRLGRRRGIHGRRCRGRGKSGRMDQIEWVCREEWWESDGDDGGDGCEGDGVYKDHEEVNKSVCV